MECLADIHSSYSAAIAISFIAMAVAYAVGKIADNT